MRAARGLVLVQPVDTLETLGGGVIVLPPNVREGMASYQCEVLDVGAPDRCEHRKCQRPHDDGALDGELLHRVHPSLVTGAWCLVRPRSFVPIADTDKRYFVHQRDIEAIFCVTPH